MVSPSVPSPLFLPFVPGALPGAPLVPDKRHGVRDRTALGACHLLPGGLSDGRETLREFPWNSYARCAAMPGGLQDRRRRFCQGEVADQSIGQRPWPLPAARPRAEDRTSTG